MGFSMISDVGNRLVEILSRELVPDVILHGSSIGLCSPDDHGDLNLGIYLYDIGLSEEVSRAGMVNTGLKTQSYPSNFLTLDYMITAYSSSDLKFRAEEEQRILGKVIQVLSDQRSLDEEELGLGASMGAKIMLQRMDQYEKIRLWTFPNEPYKLSLFYRIEPVEITSARETSIVRVRDISMLVDEDRVFYDTSLVVLPIDDFTGRPITGSNVRISVPGGRPAVIKEDGYRVFTNIREAEVTIECQSGLYENRTEKINLASRDAEQVLVLRLSPNGNYPIQKGTTCISGQTEPGNRLWFWNREGKGYRMAKDYKKDAEEPVIHPYQPEDMEMEGKSFFLCDKTGKKEYFRIIGKKEQGYLIDKELSRDYHKVGAALMPIIEVQADKNGKFFLPLKAAEGEDITLTGLILSPDEEDIDMESIEKREKIFTLEPGKVNTII